jgi:hypothetical protein
VTRELEEQVATHRHVKTGGEYTLIGIGRMQASDWCVVERETVIFCGDYREIEDVGPSTDMREVAIYRGSDGSLWVRPREEFEDGRFAMLSRSPLGDGTGGAG